MATASSKDRDDVVLDSIRRLGLGVRELWKAALGVDPNNIIGRLLAKGLIESVSRGLPQNRAYYLPQGEKPLGGQALHQRLAVAWYVLMASTARTIRLTDPEIQSVLGNQTPSGVHLLQAVKGRRPRLLHVYAPETIEVVPGTLRHAERVLTFPRVRKAIEQRDYGLLVLVPWASGMEAKMRASAGSQEQDVPGIDGLAYHDWKKLRDLQRDVLLIVERTATPPTLGLALQEAGEGSP